VYVVAVYLVFVRLSSHLLHVFAAVFAARLLSHPQLFMADKQPVDEVTAHVQCWGHMSYTLGMSDTLDQHLAVAKTLAL